MVTSLPILRSRQKLETSTAAHCQDGATILLIVLPLVAAAIGSIGVYFSNAILGVVHYTPTYTPLCRDQCECENE